MLRFKNSLISSTLFAVLLYVPVAAFSDDEGLYRLTTPIGGIAFEVVGQVTNFPPADVGQPATSQQYGYLSLINGLTADQIFTRVLAHLKDVSQHLVKRLVVVARRPVGANEWVHIVVIVRPT